MLAGGGGEVGTDMTSFKYENCLESTHRSRATIGCLPHCPAVI
jgi:hypothetical protein